MKKLLALFCAALLLGGCAGVDVNVYSKETPKLDLPTYFSGTLDAWGVFQKRDGQITRRFHVVMTPTWNGDTLKLDEQFTYADGEKQQRIWTLKRAADGSWRGTADDVKGEAIGVIAGNTLHWRYVLKLPVDGSVYEVDFDDWMWQLDDTTMLNRSTMSKFGVQVGEVTLFFRKR